MDLKELRKRSGLTQGELAEMVGVGRSTISLIELGINKPSVKLAKKLSLILDVEWTVFF